MKLPIVALVLLLLLPALAFSVNIASCPYTINTTGSYVVTGNLATTGDCLAINASAVTISLGGFTIDGDDGSGDYGVRVYTGFTDLVIANGTFTDFGRAFNIATGTHDHISIKNITMSSNAYGIYSSSSGTATGYLFQNNTITGGTAEGIYLEVSSGTPTVGNNTITGNTITSNANAQVYLGNLFQANFTGNNITGAKTGLSLATSGGLVNISSNKFYNITAAGESAVWIQSMSASSVFADNLFYNDSYAINSVPASTWTNTTFGYSPTTGKAFFQSFTLNSQSVREGTNTYFQPTFISVDSANLAPLNTSATLTLTVPVCPTKILVKSGFPTTAAGITLNGVDAGVTTTSCVGTTAVFDVASFSGYAAGYYVELLNATNNATQGSTNISQIFNITFYDESSGVNISIDSASLSYSVVDSSLIDDAVRNYSIAYSGTVNNASVRAFPNWANGTITGIESFAKSGYTTRSRFLVNANTDLSVVQNINIYLLNSSGASYGLISVVNQGAAVGGAYVSILKYFSSSSTYTQVDQKVTNSNGQAAAYIDAISYYKFAVYDSAGTLLYYSTAPEQFICTSGVCELTIDISNRVAFSMLTPYASANCYGNNTTNSIIYAYGDASGQTTSINFLAYRENVAAPVCNYTITAATGAYTCTLPGGENLTQHLYSCEVWRTASPRALQFVGLIDFQLYAGIVDWVLPALILITTLGVSAAYLPLGIGLGAISLFLMSIMGVVAIPVGTSMPIMIVGLVIAFLLSKRGAD